MSEKNKKTKSNNLEYDPDASLDTWENCYKKIYKDVNWDFWGKLNYENLKRTSNTFPRFYAPIIINEQYKQFNKFPNFKMSGDTDFNFGKFKGRKQKYEKFEKLLRRDYQKDELNYYLGMLERCYDRYHNIENFSFMPITGGLQLIKGAYEYDRPDVYVYELSKYYETGTLRNSVHRNKEALDAYLNLFDDIYDYCAKIYMIKNHEFVDKIIDQGKDSIDSGEKVVRYMELAEEFWNNKRIALNNS
ncbi:hypothetical protein [Clostridium tertium]|uniref:hypothetical protein n=1 Tax=Clostridium tertium TaxID=1559 RepID=UPI0024B35418|nr:hypothetical protein [Clostridium tertium]MDI9215607.1 hypothetical protein [Clostridium tertium]